jgi:hypothetical protein
MRFGEKPMTGTAFRQSRGLLKIEAKILPNGVRYREKGVLRSHESIIRFEDIPDEITRAMHVNRLYLFICVFFAILLCYRFYGYAVNGDVTVGTLVHTIVLLLIAVGGTWMQCPKWVGYVGPGNATLLFFDTHGRYDPTEFLQAIDQAKHAYLRAEYGARDAHSVTGETDYIPSHGRDAPLN